MTIILFLVVLAVLIFVHELGHFLVAKKSGIRVDEFAIGFPPQIISWTRGETKYILNTVPFGGYVKIFGENPDEESISGPDSARSFVNAKKWKQIGVLLSGVAMNIIFAWILISVSFMFGSLIPVGEGVANYSKYIKNPEVIVTQVMSNSVAQKIGLQAGDNVVKIISDGKQYGTDDPKDISIVQIQQAISTSKISLQIFYKRNGVVLTATATPAFIQISSTSSSAKKEIGIYMENVGIVKLNPLLALWEGGKLTAVTFKQVAVGLGTFIYQAVRGQGDFSQISGPVGIVGLVGEAAHFGLAYFLGFIAFISLNLAVINLVPFPALDGGRVFFIIIEAIVRRSIKPKIVNIINTVGFFILIALMLIITYRDIMKFF